MGEYDFIATKVEILNAETQEYDKLHWWKWTSIYWKEP